MWSCRIDILDSEVAKYRSYSHTTGEQSARQKANTLRRRRNVGSMVAIHLSKSMVKIIQLLDRHGL